jgi:hypothetical protein
MTGKDAVSPADRLEELIPKFNRAWDSLEMGDLDGFMEMVREEVDPDVEFNSGIGSVVGGGTYKGVDGVRSWFADYIDSTSERRWADRQFETVGDDIVVFEGRIEFTGAASGAPVTSETSAVFEYENGRCVRIDSFLSHDEGRRFAEARVA